MRWMRRKPPVSASTPRKLSRLWLHIGLEKTGSTSVLETLRASGDRLGALGLDVPRGPHDQRSLAHVFRSRPMVEMMGLKDVDGPEAQARYRAGLATRFAERLAAGAADEALVSDEMLAALTLPEAQAMAAYLEPLAREVRVIAYVRAPLDAAVSLSQQLIKTGHELYSDMARRPAYRPVRPRLEVFRAAFGAENVAVRCYARSELVGGSIQTDLLHAIGHAHLADHLDLRNANESVTLQGALVKSAMSRMSERPIREHAFLGRIAGHRFTLPASALEAAADRLRPDRAWLETTFGLSFADRAPPPMPAPDTLASAEVLASMQTARARVPRALRPTFDAAVAKLGSGDDWAAYA